VEAARIAKEKKQVQRQPAKVYTNEDVAGLKGDISVVGVVPEPPAADAAPAPAGDAGTPAAAAPATQVKDEAYWRKAFADARKKLADDTKELDILQREFNLKQQQFYSDPNVALREQHGREDLNRTQEQIEVKKQDVEKAKQALVDLEAELRRSGGNPGWAREQ
jgi:hypothetical protein